MERRGERKGKVMNLKNRREKESRTEKRKMVRRKVGKWMVR